jgi:hypothetical protein
LVLPPAQTRLASAPIPRAPGQAEIGLRTTRANEMWHIDTTVIRLLDGSRAGFVRQVESTVIQSDSGRIVFMK